MGAHWGRVSGKEPFLIDCHTPFNSTHLLISTLLIAGIIVSYIPQQLKIVSTRSSDGLSPWYLLLGALSSISNLFNIIVLQIPVFKCCTFVVLLPLNLIHLLLYRLLDSVYITCWASFKCYHRYSCSWQCNYGMAFRNYAESKKYAVSDGGDQELSTDWVNSIKSLRMVISYAIIVCVLSIVIGALIGVPSSVAYFWTTVLALVALVSSLIQFIPQIMRTWKLKMVGALSVPAMLMQAPGSFLFCYTLAMSPGTNFTSWITYFVGGCLQGILLTLCLYYQYKKPTEFIIVREEESELGSTLLSPTPHLVNLAHSKSTEALVGSDQ